jgi:hypothetical protein
MDRQYEHFSSGVSHHHGFLSYSPGEYIDSVAKKGMTPLQLSQSSTIPIFHVWMMLFDFPCGARRSIF